MDIVIRSTPDCPNVPEAQTRLYQALREASLGTVEVRLEVVETQEDAERLDFHGSPAIVIDGTDPFADPDAPVGFACRLYSTPHGRDAVPSVAQIREALERSAS